MRKKQQAPQVEQVDVPLYDLALLSALIQIIDALHAKDGDTATWKPIREKVEGLMNA